MMMMNNEVVLVGAQPPTNSFEDETESLYYSNLIHHEPRSFTSVPSLDSSIKMEFDPDYGTVVNPAEITGQSISTKMEADKRNFLDLEDFANNEVTAPPVEETQDLIQEMEEFLSQYEEQDHDQTCQEFENLADQLLNMEQQQTLDSMDTSCPVTNGDLSKEEIAAAEDLIDELLKRDSLNDEQENLQDSGFEESCQFNVSNVSQFNTDTGNVILVIVPEDSRLSSELSEPSLTNSGLSPITSGLSTKNARLTSVDSGFAEDPEDSDWVPDFEYSKKKPGRKLSARRPIATLKSGKVGKKSTIKDKKERKKIQNVMAARRYRDKKKLEALEAENEEQTLMTKNRELKEQLNEIENEMKTMKKLMVELGLFKVVKK